MNRLNIDQNEGFCKKPNILRPLRSAMSILQSKRWKQSKKCPALQVVSRKPSMACLGRCVSTLHNQQPQALRCPRNIRFKHLKPPLQTLAFGGYSVPREEQEANNKSSALKTDMSNLVSALLLAPEAAAICKGLWPCLGDRVLGFSVHCGVGLVVTYVGVKWRIWCFPEVHLQGPLPVGLREQRATSICCKPGKEVFCPIWHFAILPSLPSAVFQFHLNSLSWYTCLSKRFKTDDLLLCSGNGGNTWQGPCCNVNLSLASEKELGAKRQYKHKQVRTKLSYTFPRVFLSQNSRLTQHHKTSEDKVKV